MQPPAISFSTAAVAAPSLGPAPPLFSFAVTAPVVFATAGGGAGQGLASTEPPLGAVEPFSFGAPGGFQGGFQAAAPAAMRGFAAGPGAGAQDTVKPRKRLVRKTK